MLFTFDNVFSQSKEEKDVTKLSKDLFKWEVENKLDSIEILLSNQLVVVNSKGETLDKSQYLVTFTNGKTTHNSIEIEESKTIVVNKTAIVAGKGIFNITSGGNNVTRHLSYTETFINTNNGWELLALKASVIPN